MAYLQIEEFTAMARQGAQTVMYPPVAVQRITLGESSVQAENPFNSRTHWVLLTAFGSDCAFSIGPGEQTALDDAPSSSLMDGSSICIGVQANHKIAAIQAEI